jgi:cytosine/adenosine deaminase-related metal-dependent hydrolase
VLLHAHVSEGDYEPDFAQRTYGKQPMQVYEELGICGPQFLASQCVQITENEIEIIAKTGVKVAHMPLSNCEVGGGIAPIPALIEKQVIPGLGSDGYIEDFFEIMRSAFLIHKANCRDPRVMPANIVWYMATEAGAKNLGLEKIGRLQRGWKADLQLIDANLPTPIEEQNLLEQLLLYRNASHVRHVFVNGKIVLKNGLVPDLDMQRLVCRIKEEAARLWANAR